MRTGDRDKIWRRTFVRAYRLRAGLSQEELGQRIGWSDSTVSLLENQKIPYNQELLEAIAREVGCDAADLLTKDPNREADGWEAIHPSERASILALLKAIRPKS